MHRPAFKLLILPLAANMALLTPAAGLPAMQCADGTRCDALPVEHRGCCSAPESGMPAPHRGPAIAGDAQTDSTCVMTEGRPLDLVDGAKSLPVVPPLALLSPVAVVPAVLPSLCGVAIEDPPLAQWITDRSHPVRGPPMRA